MRVRTLYDKLWDAHAVQASADGNTLVYIDRIILHEVTSAQAFEGLQMAGRRPWRPDSQFAVADHQVPTTDRARGMAGFSDAIARLQVETLRDNCARHGIREFALGDARQGIVHIVGPEQGLSLPGMTLICGDSHTATHGALAAMALGVGSSELEHAMATQCLVLHKARTLRVQISGALPAGIGAKDLALQVIAALGVSGGTGTAIEYAGEAVTALDMAGRFTLCNMSIEAGARTGLVAYDAVTEAYVRGRPFAPQGADFERAAAHWRATLHSDAGAVFDRTLNLDASALEPLVTWGTKPDQVATIGGRVPDPAQQADPVRRADWQQALHYMDLQAGQAQAEAEGLDRVFTDAGFEWRDAGCSMCNAMNPDQLAPGERCASTSNRNFESRQGYRGRTHLLSPAMAAAAAVSGHLVDVRTLQ